MKRMIISCCVCLAAVVFSKPLTDLQKAYVQQRAKVVARDTATIPGHVITHFQRGNERWAETNKLAVIGIPVARKLSKLRLITTLKGIGKWDQTKEFIRTSGYEDEWLACQFLTTDYPAFVSATNRAVTAGIATDAEIKAVIEQCYDE